MSLIDKLTERNPAELTVSRTNLNRKGKIVIVKGEGKGDTVTVDRLNSVSIGRNPKENDLIIPSRSVSRKHCRIEYNDVNGTFIVTNLSTNGVIYEGQKLPRNVGVVLSSGSLLAIADNQHIIQLI